MPFSMPTGRSSPTISPVHGRGGAAGFERGRGTRTRGGRRGGLAGTCQKYMSCSCLLSVPVKACSVAQVTRIVASYWWGRSLDGAGHCRAGSAGPGRAQLWQRFVSELLRTEITQRQYLVRLHHQSPNPP